jgi:hypothetical protein
VTASGPDGIGQAAHVLEIQVGRIIEVDVGLPDPVDEQQPAAGSIRVGQQLGQTPEIRLSAGGELPLIHRHEFQAMR